MSWFTVEIWQSEGCGDTSSKENLQPAQENLQLVDDD